MEIILSKRVTAFTGTLVKGSGYYVRRLGNRFFTQRSRWAHSKWGHLRTIKAAVYMVRSNVYFEDVRVSQRELENAIRETGEHVILPYRPQRILNADDAHHYLSCYGL